MVIGSFVVEVCILNVITDDVIINTDDVIRNVKWWIGIVCIHDISNWYSMNKVCINKNKFNVMVIGSPLNLDDFTMFVDSDKLLLAR